MTPIKTRDELQNEAVRTLLERKRLIVAWGTGVGKSRVAVRTIDALFSKKKRRILLLVAETAHKDNWKDEFIQGLGLERAKEVCRSIVVECYASLEKYRDSEWDYIVADEAHHLRSELRTGVLSTLRSEYFLGLTATLSERGDGDELIKTLHSTFGEFEFLDFNVQDAIDNGILSEPTIYVHVLLLEKISAPQKVIISWGHPKNQKEIECTYDEFTEFIENDVENNKSIKATVTCTAKQGYELLTKYLDKAKTRYEDYSRKLFKAKRDGDVAAEKKYSWACTMAKNEWLQYGTRRKVLMGECKTTFSRWLLDTMRNRKYVCFCSSIEQGQELGGDNIISSRRNDNDEVLQEFNEGKRSSLFAVGMIQEGQNLKGIEAGVIVQLGGKERVFVQKFGRTMRSRNPVQHIIVMNDTQDVTYFKTAVSGINPKYIHMHKYGT
ncbi:MAG: DEAD/DEAH box helicase family protein [Bacteroidales bacterium]|nr:DEAD/DEAH box helicase family protein [Bacteroidales bacterium]